MANTGYSFRSMSYSELMALVNKIDPRIGFYVEFTIVNDSGSLQTLRAYDKVLAKQIVLKYEGKFFKAMLKRK